MISTKHLVLMVGVVSVAVLQSNAFPADEERNMHPSQPFKTIPSPSLNQDYEDPSFWAQDAQETLSKKLQQRNLIKQAKNVIFFLGDGWGVSTMTAGRILKGQEIDKLPFGEEAKLHTDTFPHTGTSVTFCVDSQVADSACTATAYLCGVKANYATLGVTSDVQRYDCEAQSNTENHVSSIIKWAQDAGKATGVVTTSRITDASPAGTYAHVANRGWETDGDVAKHADPETCDDIAEQLILREPGRNIDVILGGGREKFFPNNFTDSEGSNGARTDGKNLVEMWKSQNSPNSKYVETVEEFLSVNASTTDRLLGLFAPTEMGYFDEQAEKKDPTLSEMLEKSLQILSKNPNGFVLFIEGGMFHMFFADDLIICTDCDFLFGRIDHGHHSNQGMRSLWEAVEFDRAIQLGDEMTAEGNDTLIVVTADHSHAFTFAGYPERGSKLSGFAGMGDDQIPYSTIGYANGPGWKDFSGNQRHNISHDDVEDIEYRQVPLVPLGSDTHGGEDVPVIAKGPFSHLFSGVLQQNYIPHAVAYAACIGNGATYCDEN